MNGTSIDRMADKGAGTLPPRNQPEPEITDDMATPIESNAAGSGIPFYVTAMVAGFCMMGFEIFAGPMLEPLFGKGNDVWAGIISVFILSLSVGYTVGGYVVDWMRTHLALGSVLMLAGVMYVTMPLYAWTVVEGLLTIIPESRIGSLVASMIIYFIPSFLLGMVSPMLVKLVFRGVDALGQTTGTIYLVAAVGNVLGVLVTNFVFLDYLGVSQTLVGMGVVLFVTGAWQVLGMRRRVSAAEGS
jgi:predicted membrane-bound spermidine synthase